LVNSDCAPTCRHAYEYISIDIDIDRYKIHTYKDIDVYIYFNSDIGGLRHTVVRVPFWSFGTVFASGGKLKNTYL